MLNIADGFTSIRKHYIMLLTQTKMLHADTNNNLCNYLRKTLRIIKKSNGAR